MFMSDGRTEVGDPDLYTFEPKTTGTQFEDESYEARRMSRRLQRQDEEAKAALIDAIHEANAANESKMTDQVKAHEEAISELFQRTVTIRQHVQRLENLISQSPVTGSRTR